MKSRAEICLLPSGLDVGEKLVAGQPRQRHGEHLLLGERARDEHEVDRQADDERARYEDQVSGGIEARRSLHHALTPSIERAAR